MSLEDHWTFSKDVMERMAMFMPSGIIKRMFPLLNSPQGLLKIAKNLDIMWRDLEGELQGGITSDNANWVRRTAGSIKDRANSLHAVLKEIEQHMDVLMAKAKQER